MYISLPPGTGAMRNRFAERNLGSCRAFLMALPKKGPFKKKSLKINRYT
jgi:hypothetical protein